jgi:ABC-type transporter Mla subunit MlaD
MKKITSTSLPTGQAGSVTDSTRLNTHTRMNDTIADRAVLRMQEKKNHRKINKKRTVRVSVIANKVLGAANETSATANKVLGTANETSATANKMLGAANETSATANKVLGAANETSAAANKVLGEANETSATANKKEHH